jgi:GT2 family glycosyltransferase
MDNIFIIIPCYNKENFTKACINDLSYLNYKHKIIIIDNGSDKKSVDTIEKLVVEKNNNYNISCSFHLIKLKKNLGYGKANNYAYNFAIHELKGNSNDFFIFLNNDIRVKKEKECWTDRLVKEATYNNLVGPTGGLVDSNYNFVYETKDPNKKINYMSGWCLGTLGYVIENISNEHKYNTYNGLFPDYNLAYFEDTHLGIIASKLGINFKIVDLPLVHFGKTTSNRMGVYELYIKARSEFLKRI